MDQRLLVFLIILGIAIAVVVFMAIAYESTRETITITVTNIRFGAVYVEIYGKHHLRQVAETQEGEEFILAFFLGDVPTGIPITVEVTGTGILGRRMIEKIV